MRARRWLGIVVVLVAACGTAPASRPHAGGPGALEGVRMRVGFAWGGAEGEAFRDVLRSFSRVTGATVEPVVLPANEEQQLSSLSRSQQLDVALVSAPGIMRRLQQANDLVPIEDAETRTEIARGYDPIWRDAASVGGRPYGVLFKA